MASAAVVAVATTGMGQSVLFAHPSTTKYALTILGPLLVFAAVLSERPLRVVMLPAIVVAPLVSATAGLGSVHVSVLAPFLIAGALLAPFARTAPSERSALALAGLLAFPLLLVPLAAGSNNRPFIVALALVLSLGWLVSLVAREPGGLTAVLAAITVSAAIQSVIAIWESRSGQLLNLYGQAGTHEFLSNYLFNYGSTLRPDGTFSDPISLGNFLAIALPCALVLGVSVRGTLRKLSISIAAMLIATGLVLSLSRASWVAGMAGSIVALLMLPSAQRRSAAKAVAVAAVLIVVIAAAAAGPVVLTRFVSIGNPTSMQNVSKTQKNVAQGDQKRLEYWHIALVDAFGEHPAAGIGIEDMGGYLRNRVENAGNGIVEGTAIYLHAHSTYFQLLGEAGLFGLVLLLLFIRGLLRDAFVSVRGDPLLGPGMAGASVALLICWATDWVIHNEPVAASVGVVLGLIAAGGRLGRSPNGQRHRVSRPFDATNDLSS
jgi:O-antigen ligase